MIANHPFGACLPTFGNCADRYCLSGYGGGGSTMREMLDLAMKVEGLDGLELVGNWHVNDENIREVARMFADRGLKISMLVPDLWTQAKWGRGSLAAPDAKTRQAAVDEVRKVMDWAAELGCPYVDVWPGTGLIIPFRLTTSRSGNGSATDWLPAPNKITARCECWWNTSSRNRAPIVL